MTCKEEKKALRQAVQQGVRQLPEDYCKAADAAIFEHIRALPEYAAAKTVFVFVGMDWEIRTQPLIEDMLRAGKIVGVPLCTGKRTMEVRRITGMDDLEKGFYGLLEPKAHTALLRPDEIDLGLIPCCTCTAGGDRLGYGAGFYDVYLAQIHFLRVVLCRSRTMSETVPVEEHDQPMDVVISETGIRRTGRNSR